MKKVIVIVGPTATGKTEVAIELARRLSTEIISADARQIYTYLDIVTAKPEKEILKEIKHYMIDIVTPDNYYSAGKFKNAAENAIGEVHKKGKIPIVVGGSGLYIKALTDGLTILPQRNDALRENLLNEAKSKGKGYLYEVLKEVDPEAAKKIPPNNMIRIIRALEVYYLTGKPFSQHHKDKSKLHKNDYTFYIFGLLWDRKKLYQRIDARIEKMLSRGAIEETAHVLKLGYKPTDPGLNALGYKQIIKYLNNEIDFNGMVSEWKFKTHQYAKRQITWFKTDNRINWIYMDEGYNVNDICDKILSLCEKDTLKK